MQDPADRRPTGESDRTPSICPYGHPLTSGRVLVGWSPCRCWPAQGHYGGHRTYYCIACHELSDRRQTICYFPEHIPGPARTGPDGNGRDQTGPGEAEGRRA